MAENTDGTAASYGLGDLLGLFGTNPLGGVTKTFGQFQKGVGDFLGAIENLNATLAQLNAMAARVNGLLDAVEEPIRAAVPQITRTVKTADTLVTQMSSMPKDFAAFVEMMSDLARRLQPLGQMAESAGSLLGFRPLAALRAGGGTRPPDPAPAAPKPAAKKSPARKSPPKKP